MPRTWDQIVTDYESLAADLTALNTEARELADGGTEPPIEPPIEPPPDVIVIEPGASVQAALDAAAPGATLELIAGIAYPGRLTIRQAVTICTRDAAVDGRVTLEDGEQFAELPDGLRINPGTCDVHIARVVIGGKDLNDIVEIGLTDEKQTTRELQPARITFDQVIIVGDTVAGAKRGIAANGTDIQILRSHIADIFRVGQDTQCVCGWNGEGPILIDDCYLAAAGENVMFGGSAPAIQGLIPSDIEISGCTITKPMEWKGSKYTIKNHVEFKSGRRIHIHDNLISNMWPAGQPYSLVITPSQYGDEPDNTVEDYTFERNVVTNIANGWNILGHGQNQTDRPTQTAQRITIRDNWFVISKKDLGGNGWFMMIGNGPRALVVEHNTIQTDGPVYIQGNKPGQNTGQPGWRFFGNIVQTYGIYATSLNYNGTDHKRGAYWREYFAPDGVMDGNAFAGDESVFRTNCPDNLHVSSAEGASLVVDGYGVGKFEGYGRRKT